MDFPEFTAKLVGTHFRDGNAKAFVSAMERGQLLDLEREPTNQYDVNAVKVITSTGLHLGYVEAPVAAYLSPYIDQLAEEEPGREEYVFAEVQGFDDSGKTIYPILHISLAADEPAVA